MGNAFATRTYNRMNPSRPRGRPKGVKTRTLPAKPNWNGDAMLLYRTRARISIPSLVRRLKARGYPSASRTTLYRYELNQRAPPRHLVALLADVLGCAPDDLSSQVRLNRR